MYDFAKSSSQHLNMCGNVHFLSVYATMHGCISVKIFQIVVKQFLTDAAFNNDPSGHHTANYGPVRIQYCICVCMVPIYVFPKMKLCGSVFQFPHSCSYLWASYIFRRSVRKRNTAKLADRSLGTYKSLTDMQKLGTRPRSSISRNICFKFSVQCSQAGIGDGWAQLSTVCT